MAEGGTHGEAVAEARFRILALDDQPAMVRTLKRMLSGHGFDTEPHTDPGTALAALTDEPDGYDAALLDVKLPGISGLEVLEQFKEISPELPVIMLSGDDSAHTAVAALRAGAFNYLTKSADDMDNIALSLSRAVKHAQLHRRTRQLERRLEMTEGFETLVGESVQMRHLFATIEKLADSDVSVLLRGESGTGKELVANAIHDRSRRATKEFVALNCAAMPEALVDSELFGHTRGAFTGAISSRPGAFERADGGTLFLDEIGDIPLPVQLRLLRVLQERKVQPVGSDVTKPVDVRVIAATLVDLDDAVAQKRFRADLYYRLNVVNITLPPLRDRIDDVPLLAAHFLNKHAQRQGREVPHLSPEAIGALTGYAWPGNVRELENVIQRILALNNNAEIRAAALPARLMGGISGQLPAPPGIVQVDNMGWADGMTFMTARKAAQEKFERAYLERLLEQVDGNIAEAARRAGMDRSNLRRIMVRHSLTGDKPR